MSKESARAFYEKVKSDSKLADEVTKRGSDLTDDDMVNIAKGAGFDCTADELDEVGEELGSELSDSDLDAVAGGSGATYVKGKGLAWKAGPANKALKIKPGIQAGSVGAYKASAIKMSPGKK